jgi:hypothetical protein
VTPSGLSWLLYIGVYIGGLISACGLGYTIGHWRGQDEEIARYKGNLIALVEDARKRQQALDQFIRDTAREHEEKCCGNYRDRP